MDKEKIARNDKKQMYFLDVIFAVLALLLVAGTLVAIGGAYCSFINPSF
jgi:hypothetical protein